MALSGTSTALLQLRDFSYVRKDCSQGGRARHSPKDHGRSGRGMVTATVPNDLTTDKEKETQS